MLHIFDISGFQAATAPSGADGIFIKATEGGGYTSAEFPAQMASARSRSKVQGAYHFARPEQSSGASQADRFLAVVKPRPTDILWLDLEVSQLSQAATNAWAKAFASRLKAKAPGNVRGVYMGSGYASNGTGRDLSAYFQRWWYPQYPSAYQLAGEDVDARRAANRSHETPDRTPIAAMTSRWPPAVTPWLPSGLTCGWKKPDIWQFTDNWSGLDASVTALTIDQLATGGHKPTPPKQEDDVYGGQIPAGKGQQTNVSFPRGYLKAVGLVQDNSLVLDGLIAAEPQAQVRYAFHHFDGSWQTGTALVGSADGGKDHTPKTVVHFDTPEKVDYATFVRLDGGARPVGWDMS